MAGKVKGQCSCSTLYLYKHTTLAALGATPPAYMKICWFAFQCPSQFLTCTGAIWAGLVPTVVALAIYFCIADFVLISQCLYYNNLNARARQLSTSSAISDAEEPLLGRRRSNDSTGLPGSHRRASANRRASHTSEPLSKILEEEEAGRGAWLKNTLSIVLVIAAGAAGWVIAWRSGVWTPTAETGSDPAAQAQAPLGAEILGYFSAVCYLGYAAKLPCHMSYS